MIDTELSPVSKRIVQDLAGVTEDEEALVLTDAKNVGVARSIAGAANAVGADGIVEVMPLLDAHSNEPPDTVAESMKAADVAVTATTHSITHTRARNAASDAGTRVVVLRGTTEEMMIEGAMSADLEELREVTGAVRDVLDAAGNATVTSPEGTDVWLDLTDRPAFSLDGYFHDYGFSALPPGEAPTSPVEGSARGTVVIDYSMDNLGVLDEPIELTFEDGFVTAVEGGTSADELRRLLAEADENAGNLAEFAIGTNPKARLIGNLAEDKKKRGTIHVAVGDNVSLGGTLESELHLDGVVRHPTVRLDDEVVVEEGTLLVDRVRELAADLPERG